MPHPDSEGHTAGLFLSPKGVQSMWQHRAAYQSRIQPQFKIHTKRFMSLLVYSPTASFVAILILLDHITGSCLTTQRCPEQGVTSLPKYLGFQCIGTSGVSFQHVLCLKRRLTALTDSILCGSPDRIRPCCSAAAASWAKQAC